jgi:2-methylcitrate dehydratase
VKPDPAFDKFPGAPPVRITATLQDGQRIAHQVDNMPGFPGQPATRADVERKFRSNVDTRWPRERTDAVLGELWALNQTKNLSSLLAKLTLQG